MAAFQAETFEDLHRVVAQLASGNDSSEAEAFAELRQCKEALSKPFTFRSREDTMDLPSLARSIMAERPRLATEHLVKLVDEVSRVLRLHQSDCCTLVERALSLGVALQEVPRKCAAIFYRECHFQALCLHDMGQGLAQNPPRKSSLAFFGLLGGRRCIASLFEALGLLLRDLTGERAGDQVFLVHAGTMIQLLVETLLAYFTTFQATVEEAEQVLSLLPHVVTSQHAPIGQGFTVSDLDLVLREEHNDVSIKLCLVLVCMCHSQASGDAKLAPAKLRDDVLPSQIRLQDLAAEAGSLLLGPFGQKLRAGNYWNEESQLGQFLCFAISGVLLEDDHALRGGYVRWHFFHFLLHEVLMSAVAVPDTCTGLLVLRCVSELLQRALLPVGRRWTAVKKLEAQAVQMRLLTPDSLQISALQVLNRLCRLHPPACEIFRDVALQCTDSFHLTHRQMEGFSPWSTAVPDQVRNGAVSPFAANSTQSTAPRHDNTMLYAEILDLVATICARGSLQTASLVCQKLLSHSNQWFNWSFLLDTLMQHARVPPSTSGGPGPSAGDAMVMALCRLVSGACGGRLLVMQPTMQPIANSLNSGVASSLGDPWGRAENLAGILVDVLSAHPEPAVKAACLGALGNLDLPPPQVSRNIISSVLMAVPSLVPFVEHPRVCDGAVAIELLACVIRFLQAIPISKGRYGLDLQPLTHVVIHQVLLKALAEPSAFRSSSRYWRLAALTLRWLRLVLRGPLPMSTSSSLNALIVRPYSDSDSTAAEVSMRCAAGNATAYAFRCLLSLDSPVFARVLYLTTLQGHAMDGLTNGRRAGASQAYLEQCARHGLDVVRILLQRDVLFSRLHAQNTSERALSSMWSGAAFLQDGPILPTHRLLLAEFAFTYPPGGSGRSSSFSAFNPFWSQRPHFEQTESPDASAGSRRHNPSYLALLSEFVGVRSHNGIGRLALFVFMQCSYREPQRVLRLLQLEPWRLVALSAALYDRIVEPDEGEACKEALAAAKSQGKTWDKSTEAYFMHEAMEIDASPDFCHLDVTSFETALPLCRAVDLLQQLAEDSVVQAADISVWARGSSAEGSDAGASSLRGCASSDASLFRAAYLRGFDIPAHWLSHGATSLMAVIQNENTVQLPFAALAAESSRSLTLRFFLLLLGDTTTDSSVPSQSLTQLLLGLDPSGESSGFVDIDQGRAGNPSALDALMLLLENPPSLPAWIDSGAPRSSSRALQPRSATQPEIQEAIRNHSAYEASLSVVLSLLAMPALRDVVLRYMCHAWTSRYRVLKSLLAVSWSSLATSLQRILLSEAALILQVCAWEMRLVWPSGRPPMEHLDTTADILGQQRLDMKMNVSEHLQEVVCDLISHSDSGLAGHTSMPYLVNAALRLADACDVVDAVVGSAALQGSDSVLFGRDAMQDQLRASTCQCMAPAKAGGALSRKLELQDPHLLLHLSGLSYLLSATEAEGDRSRFAADLQLLCSRNEYACIAYYTECACSGLTTFVSAALSHLVGRPRAMIGSTESDSRAQAARAHLEALLPAMAAEEAGAEAPRRLELLSGLATAFLAAMIERSKAPPLAFVRRVYVLLSGALVRPLAVSRESRRNLQEALLVLLQRMLPDQALDVAMGFQVPDLEAEEATELARLVSSLMAAEMAEAEHVAESDPSSNGPGVSLPLLCALMTRVPARQLSTVFSGLWRQLTELIQAGSQASLRDANCLRHLHGSALAAILCQSPESASAFFEAGGLSAVLRPEMLQGRMRLAPAGLHALDTVHPAALVSVLQVLVAMLGVLPTHNLVLQSALQWLERHLQPLLDVMQWVTRLPFTTSSEPRARVGGASPSSVVAALAARTGRSAGREGPDAMLVVCRSLQNPQTSATTRDLCVDGLAFWLSGRCSMSSGSSVGADDKYADGIALCHRCLALFVELWSLVHVSVARRRKYAAGKADVYQAQLQKLEPMIHAALPGLLMQVASASAPDPDSMSDADGSAGNTMLLEALRPAEVTQHRIISNILQIWRYDSITQHIKMLATKNPQAQPSAQSAWSLWQQVQQTGPFQQVTHGSGMSQSIVGEVKVRSGVLCAVFVHACCKFLSLRLSDPLPVGSEGETLASLEATVDGQGGHGEQLHFDGVPATFTQLLYVVEISLHLLCLHLMLLTTVADLDGAPTVSAQTPPTPGPRLAIVGQYLRLLIEFAAASGGSVALVARCPRTCDLPKTVSNLAFAASAASAAEKLVAQMQLQQGGL